MLVYKYQKIDEWFYKNLINMEIFCNSPENFNDPFDCSIYIINKSIGNILKKRMDTSEISAETLNAAKKIYSIQQLIEKVKNEIYVSCFTTKNNDELMWAHYTNSHQGICIGYEMGREELVDIKYDINYPVLSEEWVNKMLDITVEKFI